VRSEGEFVFPRFDDVFFGVVEPDIIYISKPRKTAGKLEIGPELGGNLDSANLSIAQLLTGIQGDLKRFLEAY
jgi:hypothetical protein